VYVSGIDAPDSSVSLFGQPGIGRVVIPDQIVELGEVETRGDTVERDDNDLGRYLLEPLDQPFGNYRVGKNLDTASLDVIPKDSFQDRPVG